MRAVLQRVKEAKVSLDNKIVGKIQKGLLIYLGIEFEDKELDIKWIVAKIIAMRIFSDESNNMNLSVQDINGSILVISQFTLCASTKKGNRPSFSFAENPDRAKNLYNQFVDHLKSSYPDKIETGEFGGDMDVLSINDGPVTILIDSKRKI